MAKVTSIEAVESASAGNDSNGANSGPGAEYIALVEWLRECELKNEDVRVAAIVTTAKGAPEHEKLRYSYPAVKQGKIDGYERADGSVVIKPD